MISINMTKKENITKKYEDDKQSKNYISKIYSYDRRPLTNYPDKLADEIIIRNKLKKNLKLLDVGCGRGDILKAFKNKGFEVEGVDLSEESIEILKPIKVHQKNLEEDTLENREKYYDVIFSKSLIEHLRHPLKFIRNCKKLLKDDGVLIIMTPSWFHSNFGPFYLDYTHYTPFTLQSLRDVGFLGGFKKVEVNYFYQLPFTWHNSFLKIIPKIISFLKLSYLPMYEQLTFVRYPNKINTLIRFSREVMLYCEMRNYNEK